MTGTAVPYTVFTTEFDRTVDAATLAREVAPDIPAAFAPFNGRVEGRGDDRSGLLPGNAGDASSLAPGLPACDGVVQVLVDMSGSNRGTHVGTIAFVDVMALAMEEAGIRFEVLGFTTQAWKGGRSREKWMSHPRGERPRDPGRCTDILHVVFKDADAGWTVPSTVAPSPRDLFDGLLRPPHMRDNVDGEALRWALSRHEGGDRRLLFVSDGRSVDDTTMSLNGPDILGQDRDRALAEIADAGVPLTVVEVVGFARSGWGSEPRVAVEAGNPLEAARAAFDGLFAADARATPGP